MGNATLLQLDLPGIKKIKSGKVREVFDLDDRLLFVATDRISAFDCIMPNGIPRKGEVLTQISFFGSRGPMPSSPTTSWRARATRCPASLPYAEQLRDRSMLVKKAKVGPSNAWPAAIWPARAGKNTSKPKRSAASPCLPGLKQCDSFPSRSSPPPPRKKPATMTNLFRANGANRRPSHGRHNSQATTLSIYRGPPITPGTRRDHRRHQV